LPAGCPASAFGGVGKGRARNLNPLNFKGIWWSLHFFECGSDARRRLEKGKGGEGWRKKKLSHSLGWPARLGSIRIQRNG